MATEVLEVSKIHEKLKLLRNTHETAWKSEDKKIERLERRWCAEAAHMINSHWINRIFRLFRVSPNDVHKKRIDSFVWNYPCNLRAVTYPMKKKSSEHFHIYMESDPLIRACAVAEKNGEKCICVSQDEIDFLFTHMNGESDD